MSTTEDRFIWNVYLEEADSDEPKKFIGQVQALYEGQASQFASEKYEKPSHDLVVKRLDLDVRPVKHYYALDSIVIEVDLEREALTGGGRNAEEAAAGYVDNLEELHDDIAEITVLEAKEE